MAKAILAIDDDEAVHELLWLQLSGLGCAMHSAFSVKQGLDKAKELKPDLIILDFELGAGSGSEVFERLRADGALAKVPIVFLSSLPLARQVCSVPLSRGVRYLQKPPQAEALSALVAELLGGTAAA